MNRQTANASAPPLRQSPTSAWYPRRPRVACLLAAEYPQARPSTSPRPPCLPCADPCPRLLRHRQMVRTRPRPVCMATSRRALATRSRTILLCRRLLPPSKPRSRPRCRSLKPTPLPTHPSQMPRLFGPTRPSSLRPRQMPRLLGPTRPSSLRPRQMPRLLGPTRPSSLHPRPLFTPPLPRRSSRLPGKTRRRPLRAPRACKCPARLPRHAPYVHGACC